MRNYPFPGEHPAPKTTREEDDRYGPLINHKSWGPWCLRVNTMSVVVDRHSVPLRECLTGAAVLDQICRVADTSWSDGYEVVGGLTRALADLLRPRETLYVDGESRVLEPDDVPVLVERNLAGLRGTRRVEPERVYFMGALMPRGGI